MPITFTPGNPPPVLGGSLLPFNHGSTGQWGQIYSMSIAPNGSVLFLDSQNSDIYQLAPGASQPTLVVGAGTTAEGTTNCSSLEPSGTYWNGGIAVDSGNNLYVTDRYSEIAEFCRVPYNASAGTWNFSSCGSGNSSCVWGPPTYSIGGTTTALTPQVMVISPNSSAGSGFNTVYFSTSGNLETPSIYEATVNVATGAITNVTPLITGLEDFAASIAVDHAGNLFFTENIYPTPISERVTGILEIPAGTTGIAGSGNGAAEKGLAVVGSSNDYTGLDGVSFDAQGNLYFSSSYNTSYGGYVSGVFMIPNEGTPTSPNLVWNDTVMVSPVSAGQPVLPDPRGFLWISDGSGGSNWAPPGVNAPNCDTTSNQTIDATCLTSAVAIWKPGMATLGASAAGGGAPTQVTAFSVAATGGTLTLTANNSFTENQVVTFSASPTDPLYALNGLSFYVQGSPLSATQFAVSIPTTSTTAGYVAGGASGPTAATAKVAQIGTVYYTFNTPVTPTSINFGQSVSTNFTLAGNPSPGHLYSGGSATAAPACTAGTAYPAFNATETFNDQFSWCYLFVQLNSQTVGTVGTDVQMVGTVNNATGVISGSNIYLSGVGQGAAISNLATPQVYSVASGLSEPQQVAADAQGNTYVADAALGKIEKYPAGTTSPIAGNYVGSGLTAPTGVAVDPAGDVFVGDSGSVYEIPFINGALSTTTTKIATGLGTDLNLAVDSMGDIFVADKSNKQVVEISNPQSALLRQGLPALQPLASSANFTGPTAVATDNSGNVWVADGANLWEITMPFGGATKVTTKLTTPVTGLAVDPSGSVFVAEASGLLWIPYQVTSTSSGLNVNAAVQVVSGLGSNNSELPIGVALDGSENIYADYGSGTTAGLSQLSISGAISFNSNGAETNPAVPYEADAQLFNLGNAPLTLAAFANDNFTQPNTDEFSVATATLNSPACSSTASVSPGSWCYLGLDLLDTLTPPAGVGLTQVTVPVDSNAANAGSGFNLAVSANIVQDFRFSTSLAATITPNTSATSTPVCAGSTYPGCETVTVTVTSSSGTPQGSVILKVPGSGVSQEQQTQTLNSSGQATFTLTNLSGGTYNVVATYGGQGTEGATQNSCLPSGSACFAGSAYSTTLTVNQATPSFTVGPPGTEGCLTWTASNCTPGSNNVTSYLGTDFVALTSNTWFTASVTSGVGTPTGSVVFLVNGQPVDSTQPQNSLNADGIADFTLVNLPLGVYTITAQYKGDVNYATETVTLPTFQVINPSVEVTSTPATISAAAGSAVQTTLNLMPLVGFSQEVSLQCVSASLPQNAECTFAYPNSATQSASSGQINVSGTSPSTIVVTISTNVPVNSGTASIARQAPWALGGLFGFGLLGLIASRKRLNSYLTMICLAVMFSGVFMGVTSCTNAGYSTPPAAPKVTTPTGTYAVQIITYTPSTSQQNSVTTSSSTPTLQLTIQ